MTKLRSYNISLLKQNITTDHTPHVSTIIFKAQWCEWRSVLTIPYIYAINIFLPWMLLFKLTPNLFQMNGSIHHINTSVSSNFNAFSWTLRVITLANILSCTWHLMWNDVKHLASCIQNNQLFLWLCGSSNAWKLWKTWNRLQIIISKILFAYYAVKFSYCKKFYMQK